MQIGLLEMASKFILFNSATTRCLSYLNYYSLLHTSLASSIVSLSPFQVILYVTLLSYSYLILPLLCFSSAQGSMGGSLCCFNGVAIPLPPSLTSDFQRPSYFNHSLFCPYPSAQSEVSSPSFFHLSRLQILLFLFWVITVSITVL